MGALLFFLVTVFVPSVFGQEQGVCYGAGSVAGAAIGAFVAALLLVALAYYLRKLYWKSRKGKHLVFSTDPESVKDEFAFDNPGFRQEEKQAWQHEAPTLPLGGKAHVLQAEFTKPEHSKDDSQLQRARVRRVKLWARDFTGLGLRCGGGAREGVHIHSLLKNGPAAAAKLHPGDKIKSIKIEFTGTPLEDAVGILSLASPYPVELEVIEGGRASGAGKGVHHPLLKKAGSTGDVSTLEKEAMLSHPPRSPNISSSNNSTIDTIKKVISEKIISNTSLERNKKEKITTLERENEKNLKLAAKTRHSDTSSALNKPERNKTRHSTGTDIQAIQAENNMSHLEHAEVQKREYDPKRGMKFGIRVLPPNVPDDGILKQKSVENGVVVVEKKTVDEPDKPAQHTMPPVTQVRHEVETELKKPVVTKRREKMAPPVPNARVKINESEVNGSSQENSKVSDDSTHSFNRSDLNSSGIKRDENGIPQELPQHMLEAANAVRNNRKSSSDTVADKEKVDIKKEELPKPAKKSKGKAPSPPEIEKNKTDDSILEQMKNVKDFLKSEKHHSSLLFDSVMNSSARSITSYNTSTPKINKTKGSKLAEESINFSQDDIDDIVSKPFKRESDSLNNYYDDNKSCLSSNHDGHSVLSFNNSDKSEKGSTTIELNNSDITIHSSATNETVHSALDNTSIVDENERKVASLGDLSRFDIKVKSSKPNVGTLERAQSLDISGDDNEDNSNALSPKKRKAMSVAETSFFESNTEDNLPNMIDSDNIVLKHKEPRLSLNIAKTSVMDGLNTFQRNRLKKGSEFGNLEDAIVKGSTSSIESDKNYEILRNSQKKEPDLIVSKEQHETSDHLAKRIMDENLKVHFKLVSEFAKSTSDGSNMSSLDSSLENQAIRTESSPIKYEEKLSMSYDTNIPDDLKVSRNTYKNSLERPKSEMLKKLLEINPILGAHKDQTTQKTEDTINKEVSISDSSKTTTLQPDIVNFDLKHGDHKSKQYDEFVSNIKVGSNNNSLKSNKISTQQIYNSQWSDPVETTNNVVTISTNEKTLPGNKQIMKTYTKSIEIGEPTLKPVPDVIDDIKRQKQESDGRTLYMEPANMSITMTQEPLQKTVTVNVTEDEFGNKVITQNVEQFSTRYLTSKSEVPLQVEQMTFGIMKNSGEIDLSQLEEGYTEEIDRRILEKIKKENPGMIFTSEEPSFTKTETVILSTDLDEEKAKALMSKIQNDPKFMEGKTPEQLSKMGIRIVRDLDEIKNTNKGSVEVTKTRYAINPTVIKETQNYSRLEKSKDSKSEQDHVIEIEVVTPRTEKNLKQKSEKVNDIIFTRNKSPDFKEPPLYYELDIELLNDFITNERYHTAKLMAEIKKRTNQSANEPKKRHSDFDLPRNSHIKFRTATYEPPKGTIVTSTDIENRRLSQLDQMQLRSNNDQLVISSKPVISAKPSSIPVKMTEKPKPVTVSSKIPVISHKSYSQENLVDKNFPLPRSPPPQISSSSGGISVTSIKSSSRSPSGGML